MDKAKFIAMWTAGFIAWVVILTACWEFISSTALTAAADPSVAAFPNAAGGLKWSLILLYLLPGIIYVAAVAWKLKKG